jgi:hypothetical protein
MILTVLYDSPLISIRELADQVALSSDGLKSALRKLYHLFDIQAARKWN